MFALGRDPVLVFGPLHVDRPLERDDRRLELLALGLILLGIRRQRGRAQDQESERLHGVI